ncbi:putative DD34D transposase [Trichonephila clavipes]|nr:putative DD34D transposase [Trichonephila clavipes]
MIATGMRTQSVNKKDLIQERFESLLNKRGTKENSAALTSIFDVKDAPRKGWPVVENIDTITEIIEVDQLAKRNEIDPFLKRMVTGDEKWVTYYNIVRKRSWLKCGEAAQTVAQPGLTARKVLLCIWWDWK